MRACTLHACVVCRHAGLRACMHVCIRVYVHACMHMCSWKYACMRMDVITRMLAHASIQRAFPPDAGPCKRRLPRSRCFGATSGDFPHEKWGVAMTLSLESTLVRNGRHGLRSYFTAEKEVSILMAKAQQEYHFICWSLLGMRTKILPSEVAVIKGFS